MRLLGPLSGPEAMPLSAGLRAGPFGLVSHAPTPGPGVQRCIRREGTSEAALGAVTVIYKCH